ncbi:MAG TPA: hypothetical protein VE172_00585 [Stackebrandtia sp.]|uniref:hypothetical protein n=1 Tax=Stackebrandtia sp. TaxID=2023065 RepID=UPI002D6CE6AA|nr:hypothetical protein [Stackebrandtia sp.]HZE37285.1 hypothetical protein [Stackebrandtia sp.]
MTRLRTNRATAVAADLVRAQGYIVLLFWGAMIALFGVISTLVNILGTSHSSAWVGARWWPQFFLLSMGVQLTAQFLRIHVSHGVTRRAFALGGVLYGVGMSVFSGIVMQLGFVVERAVFAANGWEQFHDQVDIVASPLRAMGSGLEFVALYAAYFFAGWLISTCFYRLGVVIGLLSIIPAVAPSVTMELLQWHNPTLLGMLGSAGRSLGLTGTVSTYPAIGAIAVAILAALTIAQLKTAAINEK